MAFSIVLGNMVMILLYVVCGFLLIRSGKGHESHAKTLSAILLYICGPGMIISTFQAMEYNRADFIKIGWFFLL